MKGDVLFELLFIGLSAIFGQFIVYPTAWYFYKRNIYTQKILFLNNYLRNLSDLDKVNYRMSKFLSFRAQLKFEEKYPPTIIAQNFEKNLSYRDLCTRFQKTQRKYDLILRVTIVTYLIGLAIIGVFYFVYSLDGSSL